MRKLDEDSVMLGDDTADIYCEKCGSRMTLVIGEEDACSICNARYFMKPWKIEVWRLEEGDDMDDLEEREEGDEEEEE